MPPESRQASPRSRASDRRERVDTVGRLAGGLAHDLNNLLTAIAGCADLVLVDLAPDDPRREPLEEIKADTAEAARVVRKLVSYAGQAPTRRQVIGVGDLLDGLEEDVIRRRGGEVRTLVLIESAGMRVRVDPDQIRDVLDTLIDNALEAMPGGGVLFVRARPVEGSRGRRREAGGTDREASVCVEVADNGTGMDPATLSRAVEPYFSTRSGGAGRGLELPAARQLARQNGGALRLESEPDRGTSARLLLPAAGRFG